MLKLSYKICEVKPLSTKRVTIKDIANELGVSCAIINRALNNKSGVSAELREKILETADRLGYRPNKLARSLARSTMKIGIVIPNAWESFYSFVERGIVAELDRLLDYNVEGAFYRVDNPYSATDYVEKIRACISDRVDGIIITDSYHEGMDEVLCELSTAQIPTVTIGALSQSGIKTVASVSIDSHRSGEIAAEMLMLPLGRGANVAVFIGNKNNAEHSLKANGFVNAIERLGGSLVGCFETDDNPEKAKNIFCELAAKNEIHGIYLATAGSDSVLSYITDSKLPTKIVTTDVSCAVRENISGENLICTLFQDPERQGRVATRTLYDFLSEGVIPPCKVVLSPEILIAANIDAI